MKGTWIMLLVLLVGCDVPEERELVVSTDRCLREGHRAVMMCPAEGRCWVECR